MRYCAFLVDRSEDDKPISWQPAGPVRETFDEALGDAAATQNPFAEVATMIRGGNVWTPTFA